METKFNLSEQSLNEDEVGYSEEKLYWESDITEFIHLLKEFMYKRYEELSEFDGLGEVMLQKAEIRNIEKQIDTLAGSRLGGKD